MKYDSHNAKVSLQTVEKAFEEFLSQVFSITEKRIATVHDTDKTKLLTAAALSVKASLESFLAAIKVAQ